MKISASRILAALAILATTGLVVIGSKGAEGTPPTTGESDNAGAGSAVSIQLDPASPGFEIPSNFTGLSFEAHLLFPDQNGKHYFRADNQPLIDLFHTLGIKSLRIGGNSSDRDARRLPSEADIDNLFAFAEAADVKVIYCLRLHNGDPDFDSQTVQYIMNRYSRWVDCFSIGQEPSAYPVEKNDTRANSERMGAGNEKYTYATYHVDWKRFADAIIAEVPEVKLCGPSVHNSGQWATEFMQDFDRSNHVTLITEHLYPGGAGGKVPTPEIGRDRMLSDTFVKSYQKLYDGFVPMALSNGLPYRLEEVNNYFNGGATNVSNTFASSLWGLDFMYWWAEHQAAGVNFHTGDRVAAGSTLQPSKYTAFFSTINGYMVRPLGYGIKAFDLGSHGRFLPITLSNPENLKLHAYAVLARDTNIYVTLINKEHGETAHPTTVKVIAGTGYQYGECISLAQSSNDVAATSGIRLGNAEITSDGNWVGSWKSLGNEKTGTFAIILPPASAIVVRLSRNVLFTANYDESKVGTYTLPDPLKLENGKPVTSSTIWLHKRRSEILKLYEEDIYGRSPTDIPPMKFNVLDINRRALDGEAIRKQVEISFPGHTNPVFHVLLYTPANANGPVPTFLCLSFSGNEKVTSDPGVYVNEVWDPRRDVAYMPTNVTRGTSHSWKIPETLARGYGIAVIYYCDIEPDLADGSGWRYGVRSLFLKAGQTEVAPDAWGAIGAWAWGVSRVMDYLETDKEVDTRHVIMLGQSRLGKTALWAGAQDPRFCMVIASCSGEMGASLARRDFGETVTSMARSFPYQFCRNFLNYSNRISEMPVDTHMLLSLIAPRPLYLSTASLDLWGDPHGEFLAAQAATPVYKLFGLQGLDSEEFPPLDKAIMHDIGFSCHTGKHDILPGDWDRFLDFTDLHLRHTQSPPGA